MGRTLGLRSKKLWYLNLSSSTSFSFTSCSIRDLDESNHLHGKWIQHLQKQTLRRINYFDHITHEWHCNPPQHLRLQAVYLPTVKQSHLTPGWSWLCPAGTGACRVWPRCPERKLAGWRRGCWGCPRRVGCPQTRQWWVTGGFHLWSHRWGSSSYCTSRDWSKCSLKKRSHLLVPNCAVTSK